MRIVHNVIGIAPKAERVTKPDTMREKAIALAQQLRVRNSREYNYILDKKLKEIDNTPLTEVSANTKNVLAFSIK